MRCVPALALFAAAAALPGQNQGLVLANGADGYVDVPYSSTLNGAHGFTVEAWVTYNAALGSGWRFPTLARLDPSPNQSSWFLRVEAGNTLSNRMLFWVTTSTGTYTVNWFFPAGSLATWTHLAATYDGSALRIFANGAQVAQTPASGTVVDNQGILRIGSGDLSIAGGETWNGEIDEVRLWPFARDAAAITATMNQRLAGIPGEVSTWNFDGDALDSSGANPGTAAGTYQFAANALPLTTPAATGLFPFGAASGCQTGSLCAVTSLPQVGNPGFGYVGRAVPGSPLGLLLIGTNAMPAPFPIFGIDLYVDLNTGVIASCAPDVIGNARVPVAIPANPVLVGFPLVSEFAWFDAACASGFSASGALTSLVQ